MKIRCVTIIFIIILNLGTVAKAQTNTILPSQAFYNDSVLMQLPDDPSIENEKSLDTYYLDGIDSLSYESKGKLTPYHRFTFQIPDYAKTITLRWTGKAKKGLSVSLYAYNIQKKGWDKLKTVNATGETMTLTSEIGAFAYDDNGIVNGLICVEYPQKDEFNFIWMSDTQYYSASYPAIYNSMVDYIVTNKNKYDYVIHTGDIVDTHTSSSQWTVATNAMKKLDDANVPNGVLAGNHDMYTLSWFNENYSYYYQHFEESRYNTKPWYGGSYQNNRGHYDLMSFNGIDFIILYMGNPATATADLNWMNTVLTANKDKIAIVCVHDYLSTKSTSRSSAGNTIYNSVISKNPNVYMVLCGHNDYAERRVDTVNGKQIFQLMADYQSYDKGGNGLMRFLRFNMQQNKIYFTTYSPYTNSYNYYANKESDKDAYGYKDEFALPLDMAQGLFLQSDYAAITYDLPEQIMILDAKGVKFSSENGLYAKAEYTYVNGTNEAYQTQCLVAQYDQTNKIVDIKSMPLSFSASVSTPVVAQSDSVRVLNETSCIKAFLFEDFNNILPVIQAVEIR